MEGKTCENCKYRHEPIMSNCDDCKPPERKGWEPAPPPDINYRRIEMGAPEGDKMNVRRPWPLDGMEINPRLLRKPSDIIDDDENGPVFAITRMPLQMVIGYAIDGIKDHVSKLGLLLTDRSKTEKDLEDTIIELRGLHTDWDSLETELEALRKAVEHGNGND